MNNNSNNCTGIKNNWIDELDVIPIWSSEYDYLDSEDDWLNHHRNSYPEHVKNLDIRRWMKEPFEESRRQQRHHRSITTSTTTKERSRSVSLGRVSTVTRRLLPPTIQVESSEGEDEEGLNEFIEENGNNPLSTPGRIMPVAIGSTLVERTKTFTRKRLPIQNGTITKLIKRTGTFKARSLSTANGSTGSINVTPDVTNNNHGNLHQTMLYNNNFEYFRDLETSKSSQDILSRTSTTEDVSSFDRNERFVFEMNLNDNDDDNHPLGEDSILNTTFTRMSRLNTKTFRKPSSSFGINRTNNNQTSMYTHHLNVAQQFPSQVSSQTNDNSSSNNNNVNNNFSSTSTSIHAEPKIFPRRPAIPTKPIGLIGVGVRKIPEPRSLSSSREHLAPSHTISSASNILSSTTSGLRAPQVRSNSGIGWSSSATQSSTSSVTSRNQAPSGISRFSRR